MKTTSTHLNINNSLITIKKSSRNYDQAAGDMNRNASKSEAEYQRDACEQELYRLRYGIENLLANNEQDDFQERLQQQQRQRFTYTQNPFRTMTDKIIDMNNWTNMSWIDRYTPCCRRNRRNRYDDNINISDEYTSRPMYNDRNYQVPTHRTPESSVSPQDYGNSFMSTSISPHYVNPNINHTRNDSRQSINDLINRNTFDSKNILNLLNSRELNDPIYNALIVKILEAKALDCLCTGYSKRNTQKQISEALAKINERNGEHQWDSASIASSRSMPASYESSSSSSDVSSILNDDESLDSRSMTSQLYSPSPSIVHIPNRSRTTSTIRSPNDNQDEIRSSLKLTEDLEIPNKQSKVTLFADKKTKTNKSKKVKKKPSSKPRKKTISKHSRNPSSKHKKTSTSKHSKIPSSSHRKTSSSKHRKTSTSKHSRRPSSNHRKTSSSKQRKQSSSKNRKQSTTTLKKPSKTKKSSTKPSSSKLKQKKATSKSRSRSKSSKKQTSKHKKNSRKKRTKPKSNNQMNDSKTIVSPTFIYPQSYQEVYKNRQRILKFFL